MKSGKTRNGKKCVGKLYSLTKALGRSAELPVNSQVCGLHWDEIRRQNNRWSCSIQINFERVITESTLNENEQHKQHKLETGNGRSERMRRRFAGVFILTVLSHGTICFVGYEKTKFGIFLKFFLGHD